MTTHALTEAAPTRRARPLGAGGCSSSSPVRCSAAARSGSTPTSCAASPDQIAEAVREGIQVAVVVGRRQLLPRRRAAAEGHGPLPRRLHRHARHGDELPGPAGLPREGGHRHPRADRHHHGPGRRALHPPPRDPPPREGPGRHLRRRRRDAVLLHRHGQRPAGPGVQVRRRADEQERGRRRLRLRPAHQPRRPQARHGSPSTRPCAAACGSSTRRRSACAWTTSCPMVVFGMEGDGNITRALLGERIGTLVSAG